MLSTTLTLLSFSYLVSATDEDSAFGDLAPSAPPKRKLTLRKPTPTDEESDSAFGDGDYAKPEALSSKPELRKKAHPVEEEESAFGDVDIDYLHGVVEDAHESPKPSLRKKKETVNEESAFGDAASSGASLDEKEIEQLDEKQSLMEESALGGELKDEAEDSLDDADIKAQSEGSEKGLDSMSNTNSGLNEDAKDDSAIGGEKHELRSEEVREATAAAPADVKECVGPQCQAEKWSPVRNVHAHGPSGKPADWKPRKLFGNKAELMSDEQPRERGRRVYSRHMAVEHQKPEKRSLGDFVSSILDR